MNITLENKKMNANSLNDIVGIVVEHFVMRSDGMFESNHFATAPSCDMRMNCISKLIHKISIIQKYAKNLYCSPHGDSSANDIKIEKNGTIDGGCRRSAMNIDRKLQVFYIGSTITQFPYPCDCNVSSPASLVP